MQQITKDMTINQILKLYPSSIAVLNKFNLDTCCGGNRTLEQAAKEDKAVVEELLTALNTTIN